MCILIKFFFYNFFCTRISFKTISSEAMELCSSGWQVTTRKCKELWGGIFGKQLNLLRYQNDRGRLLRNVRKSGKFGKLDAVKELWGEGLPQAGGHPQLVVLIRT